MNNPEENENLGKEKFSQPKTADKILQKGS